jgi:hypothetical protein
MPKDQWRRANNRARYGPIQFSPGSPARDGPHFHRKKKRRKKKRSQRQYLIPAGTICECRPRGENHWFPHWTLRPAFVPTFSWRNQTHHGFFVGDIELKVANGRWVYADQPLRPPIPENAPV